LETQYSIKVNRL